jgi:tetratricopeptide (TPR) repeat protein
MNATASVVVSVLFASAAAAGITIAMQPEAGSGDQLVIEGLQADVKDLRKQNEQLQTRLDEVRAKAASAAAPASLQRTEAPTLSPDQVAAAVEAYLDRRGSGPADAAAAKAGDAELAFDVEGDLDTLLGSNYWDNADAWKRAFDAGKMDEVIDAFKELADANPNDPKAQMDLANAYMAYLQMDNSKWNMSMLADKQFDKVLAIDGNHWEARFTKAVSYTFWPKFLGKNKEAISHFETLIEQQKSQPVQDHHAQTYLYLGNMLADEDPERARQIWQQGATRHPNNTELRGKLGGN